MMVPVPSRIAGALTRPGRALRPRALSAVRRAMGASGPSVHDDSPQFRDGSFHNSRPMRVVEAGSRRSMAREFATKGRVGKPSGAIPLTRPSYDDQVAGCAATWLGHATVLIEIGGPEHGHRVLTDPVWSERCSPSQEVGPRRSHPMPIAIDDLPPLSAVLLSHDHYDHLDTASIDALVSSQDAPFVVPLGIGAHLRGWGVPEDRIVELDWGQQVDLDGLVLTCAEARHFSGRFFTENPTLWSAWLVEAGSRTVFFGGDSGYTEAFAAVGAAHGPIDLTIVPIGAYDVRWPDVHLDPEEAVQTHLDLRGQVMLPIHWATFDLAFHPWAEPADRVRAAAAAAGVRLAQPQPGERVDVERAELPMAPWWDALR